MVSWFLLELKYEHTLAMLCSVSPERKPGHTDWMGIVMPCKQGYELSYRGPENMTWYNPAAA